MPYIPKDIRVELDKGMGEISPSSVGQLNYVITKLLLRTNPSSYREFNALVGVLECVKLELYRKMVAPYEDRKRMENGEVYPE